VYGDANDLQRAVTTRTVSDGPNSQTWTYSYTLPTYQSNWIGQTIITAPKQDYDPAGNDAVHTIAETHPSDFSSAFEYQIDYYQGAHSAGVKLRKVSKVIAFYSNPYYPTGSTPGFGPYRVGQLLNSETTTTLPNGQQSQTAYTYDGGFMVNNNTGQQCCQFYYCLLKVVKDYDYGLALLRSTGTTYAYENNGNYLTYNIIDKVALKTISDGLGNLAASTSMGYDSRGNRTSVSDCSAITSNSCSTWITTTYSFYSNGNIYQRFDPQYVDGQTGSANQPVTTYQYDQQTATYLTPNHAADNSEIRGRDSQSCCECRL
jgi:hypothetical protein